MDLHDGYDHVHLVAVDRHHTTWVLPNPARMTPFTASEHANLTSDVVFGSDKAWSTFTDDDILVFHSTDL